MVSSVKTRAAAAFVTGWLSTLAWCLTATSAGVYDGETQVPELLMDVAS